eukprot:74343-Amphidinium_carterae.1
MAALGRSVDTLSILQTSSSYVLQAVRNMLKEAQGLSCISTTARCLPCSSQQRSAPRHRPFVGQ